LREVEGVSRRADARNVTAKLGRSATRFSRWAGSRASPPWQALTATSVAAIAAWTAWSNTGWQVQGGDYSRDYAPAMNALLHGHLGAFFADAPTNGAGGSLLLRAPFALLGSWLGNGEQIVIFRVGAIACLLGLSALGVMLALEGRRRGAARAVCFGLIAVYVGAPALLQAVYFGHPEECLGAALAVGAVALTAAGYPLLGGMLLGAAVINKPWGILAAGPVLLCAGARWRRSLIPAGAIAGGWMASGLAIAPSHFWSTVHGAEGGAYVAHPQNLWWPFAHVIPGGYARPPALLEAHARQLALLLALGVAAALAIYVRRAGRHAGVRSCLALLALSFALRGLLEPSAHVYYQLPFVVALAAWEVYSRRSIAISMTALLALALDFRRLEEAPSGVPFAVYLAIVLPVCALLLGEVFGGEHRRAGSAGPQRAPAGRRHIAAHP
jgi:hypothetical protein